jgi:DNA-binding CsgD family transcriptional regulator/tRNA A-37 threonylcarbamoyl transferase component Bud32
MSDLASGTWLAGYRLERLIGAGGMGSVYLTTEVALERRVAVKVIRPELASDDRFRRRFLAECKLIARLEHPAIVPVYSAGESDGRLFIAMRYLAGGSLEERLRRDGPLSPAETMAMLAPVADALDAAHAAGMVHRDVTPGNILVEGFGAFLCDFGLARRAESASGFSRDDGLAVSGTLGYVAPEQLEGDTVDGRSDQYALACVLFECLAGRQPFARDVELAVVYAHLSERPPSLSGLNPALPSAVDVAVERGLAKRREDRYASCAELVETVYAALRPTWINEGAGGAAAGPSGLVGRGGQLAVLHDAMRAAAEQATIVLIQGEAGIGKSRLVGAFIKDVTRAGQQVLLGGCVILSGEPIPYAPVAEMVRQIRRSARMPGSLSGLDDAEIDALLQFPQDSLSRNRVRMFEQTLRLLEQIRPDDGVLGLVLEDAHWADEGTVDLVGFLARNLTTGILLVITYRNEEIREASPMRMLLRRLRSDLRVRSINVPPLNRAELTQLAIARIGREPSSTEIERLWTRSEGNPFFAEELLTADQHGGLPETLQDLLLARAERLDDNARKVMRVAAVIGRPLDHETLAEAMSLDEQRLIAAVEQCVTCGLLSVDGQRERYVFRHVLTQDAVLATLLPGERRRLHRAVAATLASQPNLAVSASRTAEWATHVLAGGPSSDEAAAASLTAGRMAMQVYAYSEAWRMYQRAVMLSPAVNSDAGDAASTRAGLLAEAAEAARRASALSDADRLASEALELETAADKRAMIMEARGRDFIARDDFESAKRLFDLAAKQIADYPATELTARIATSQAHLEHLCDHVQLAAERARRAIELAVEAHAHAEEARARSILGHSLVHLGDISAGVELARRGHEMTEKWGDIEDRQQADSRYAYALHMAGRTREACDVLLAALATVRRYGTEVTKTAPLTNNLLTALRQLGRWSEAEQLAIELLTEDLPARQARLIELCRTELDISRGHTTAARAHLARAWQGATASQEPSITSDLHLAEAELALLSNDFKAAGVAIGAAASAAEESEVDRVRARVAQRGLFMLADYAQYYRPAEADTVLHELSADYFRDQLHLCVVRCPSAEIEAYAQTGEAEYSRGQRRPEPASWRQAAELWQNLDRPRGVAYCTFRWAEAELLAGRSIAAAPPLRRAYALAAQLGAEPIQRSAEDLAHRGRITLQATPASPTRPEHALGLTDRELDVLRELTLGLTNREIAENLFISRRTVGVHITNLLTKLSAHSRTEAAALATRLHLLDDE